MTPLFAVHVPQEVDAELLRVLHSGYIGQGPEVDAFEREFGEFIGNPNVVAVNSGTSALTLAYHLVGLKPGDEVITTPMTCTATNLPILHFGARIIWADVDPDTGLIDPEDVRSKLGVATAAIVCVDWGGMPCDVRALRDINAWDFDPPVIEDAAHALGASIHGLPVGAWSPCVAYSLQAIKHITTGDGGILSMSWIGYPERARLLRWFGIDRDAPSAGDSRIDVDIHEAGYKFHMNDLAAVIGRVQLRYLKGIVEKHRANAAFYHENLPDFYVKPLEPPDRRSSYWLYTLLLPDEQTRDEFRSYMTARGIQVSRVHRPNDEYTVFKPYGGGSDLPGVRSFSSRMICVPVHWKLTQEELETVVEACEEFARVGV